MSSKDFQHLYRPVQRCREPERTITNLRTSKILSQRAYEAEAEIKRFETSQRQVKDRTDP